MKNMSMATYGGPIKKYAKTTFILNLCLSMLVQIIPLELRRLLVVLATMNSTKMVREFNMVGNYDLKPVRSVYDYLLEALLHVPNVNNVLERELTSVGRDFYQMVVPWLVASETSGFDSSSIFFSDGSKGEAGTGLGVYRCDGPESSFRLREPIG
jgi:hypothetical protein